MRIEQFMVSAVVAVGLVFGAADFARAQRADAESPSLATAVDAEPPYARGMLTTDLRVNTRTEIGAALELAFARWHSVRVACVAPFATWPSAPTLELAYHAWVAGEGTRGLWFGPALGVLLGESLRNTTASLDLGHAWNLSGIALGASLGVASTFGSQSHVNVSARVALVAGYAW